MNVLGKNKCIVIEQGTIYLPKLTKEKKQRNWQVQSCRVTSRIQTHLSWATENTWANGAGQLIQIIQFLDN